MRVPLVWGMRVSDGVLHLDLVPVGEDRDGVAAVVGVGLDQLGDTIAKICWFQPRITTWPSLDHARAALAQLVSFLLDAVPMMPMRIATTKMPPSVTMNSVNLSSPLPVSFSM